MRTLTLTLALAASLLAQTKPVHVTSQAIPATATAPPVLEGGTLNATTLVSFLSIANPDSAAYTITVADCSAPPFVLFNAYSVSAASTWTVPLGGTRFAGCFHWSASQLSATDLVIDGTLNTKVTSASHTFTANDVGKVLAVTAGTGFTPGSYTIASVTGSAAVCGSAVGTVASTGGTYTLPMLVGTLVGTR